MNKIVITRTEHRYTFTTEEVLAYLREIAHAPPDCEIQDYTGSLAEMPTQIILVWTTEDQQEELPQ